MHEFSLAQNIVEIVDRSLAENGLTRAAELVLEIGTLSGVEIPALEFALESLRKNSSIERCNIRIARVGAQGICRNCHREFEPEEHFSACPHCDGYGFDLIKGHELLVKSIVGE